MLSIFSTIIFFYTNKGQTPSSEYALKNCRSSPNGPLCCCTTAIVLTPSAQGTVPGEIDRLLLEHSFLVSSLKVFSVDSCFPKPKANLLQNNLKRKPPFRLGLKSHDIYWLMNTACLCVLFLYGVALAHCWLFEWQGHRRICIACQQRNFLEPSTCHSRLQCYAQFLWVWTCENQKRSSLCAFLQSSAARLFVRARFLFIFYACLILKGTGLKSKAMQVAFETLEWFR